MTDPRSADGEAHTATADAASTSAPAAALAAGGGSRSDGPGVRLVMLVGAVVLALLGGFGLGRVTAGGGGRAAGSAPVTDVAAGVGHTHAPGTAPHSHAAPVLGGPAAGVDVGG